MEHTEFEFLTLKELKTDLDKKLKEQIHEFNVIWKEYPEKQTKIEAELLKTKKQLIVIEKAIEKWRWLKIYF